MTAAQPTSTGTAPAAPPMTMFWRARALQPERVDADVERGGGEGEHGRRAGWRPHHSTAKATTSRATAKTSAWRGSIDAGDERAVLGALHQRVDVAVDVHVDGVGAAGGQRAADQRDQRSAPSDGQPPLGEHHRRHGRDQQQLDDPRLGQRDVGAEHRASACAAMPCAPSTPPGASRDGTRGRLPTAMTRPSYGGAASADPIAASRDDRRMPARAR